MRLTLFKHKPSSSTVNLANNDRRHKDRQFIDKLAQYAIAIGGNSVIFAIALIFFYLAYVTIPLFYPASLNITATYSNPVATQTTAFHTAIEEQAELLVRFHRDGEITFHRADTGEITQTQQINFPHNATITSFAAATPLSALVAYGFSDGSALVLKHVYHTSYPNDQRVLTPNIEYPYGNAPLQIDENQHALKKLAIQHSEESMTIVASTSDDRVVLTAFEQEDSLFEDEVSLNMTRSEINYTHSPAYLFLDAEQRYLHLIDATGIDSLFDISDKEAPALLHQVRLINTDEQITAASFLAGTYSLLLGSSTGNIVQWFPVRDQKGDFTLKKIRSFKLSDAPVSNIIPEYYRKGFIATDNQGKIGLFHSTSQRQLASIQVTSEPITDLILSPQASLALIQDSANQMITLHIDNEHPEVSWHALWQRVWYEGYEEPEYIWQSSSASNDFEPKFSLIPLSFGTLKAAFYAMLIAMPLAILGAIFTAYFMSPKLRQTVKPTIEVMEALPTVILGFLAGLWLAPFVEEYLPSIFSLSIILPLGILIVAFCWTHYLPASIRHRIPEGWQPILLIPVVLLLSWFAFVIGPVIESIFFDANMRLWLEQEAGITFDQRNAIIVGLAMGFAIIPTIYSIAEDAIFGVPKQLTNASLALGATTWQTLVRIVIPTASPGIFSAIMIGLGRAVGETMIVLMATGNTPLMDFNIFQGMRTLSANIAVEMPESEVHSTHFRVLFLAVLVLFVFTFLFNTLAEIIRQRLRRKYSTL